VTISIETDASTVARGAAAGFVEARSRVDADTERLAAGDLDPALILDISTATARGAALAEVIKGENAATSRLLDTIA